MALVAAMLAFTLAGCGGSGGGTTTPAASTEAPAAGSGETTADTSGGGEVADGGGVYNLTPGEYPIVLDESQAMTFHIARERDPRQVVETAELETTLTAQEITGVNIEWEDIPTVGLTEKVNLILTGSELPDALWNCVSNDMISTYMGQGIIIPVNDLEQYMPNLQAIYEAHPEYKALATAPDGNRYGFPYIEEMYGLVLTPGPFLINQDWLDQVDKEMPTTIDEWVDCLRAFKEAGDLNGNGQADEVPLTFGMFSTNAFNSYNIFDRFCAAYGTPCTEGNNRSDDFLTIVDDKVVFSAAEESFKETCRLFNTLWEEGLIDVNAFTAAPNPAYAMYNDMIKGEEAIYGCFGVWSPENDITNNDLRAQYAPLPRLEGPEGGIAEALNFSEMQVAARFVITSACEHPEVLAKYVDAFYEPYLSISQNWSPAGGADHVYHEDENGRWVFHYNDDGSVVLAEGYESISEANYNLRGAKGPTAILNDYYELVEYDFAAQNLLAYQQVNGKEEYLEEVTPYPPMLKTSEEMATITQIQTQIRNIVNSYRMQWIMEGGIDEGWDGYIAELEAAGLQQMLDVFQGAYDRYLENMQ